MYIDRIVTCCFLWKTSLSHLNVLINIFIICFKDFWKLNPFLFRKNKVPSFFVGYFNKFSTIFFSLVLFPKFWWLCNVASFFRIQRIDTNKRRIEESLHSVKGKIIFFLYYRLLQFLLLIWIFQKNEIRYELFETIHIVISLAVNKPERVLMSCSS